MAGRSVSPGGALLRTSRMFSMPAPIPNPPGDFSSATNHYSATATVPFPTRLTITTPSSSRVTGDWGFKRAFPLKTTTKTTYPLIRVKQVDSVEQITDFQSAGDHTITMMKYQEMNLPISIPSDANNYDAFNQARNPKSVFEEDRDITAWESEEQREELETKRWKFTGPWLAGMTDGDFNKYIKKQVRNRRPEFRAYLKEKLAARMTQDQAQKAREDNEPIPPEIHASEITDSLLTDYLRELREDRLQLYTMVGRFLDLAPVALEAQLRHLGTFSPGKENVLTSRSLYAINGPPVTHPSAGLSYLRTQNFQDNHPVYGPQAYHPPIRARVLKPRSGQNVRASIGVGGFVVSTPGGESTFNANRLKAGAKHISLHQVALDGYGGAKLYVQPMSSTLDSTGKIIIGIDDPNLTSITVQKERVGEDGVRVFDEEIEAHKAPKVPLNPTNHYRTPSGNRAGPRALGSAQGYGLGRDREQDPY
ncbi:mitochondrial ribosomal protein MRP51 [Whalleya microplaca]|nr:mitochondrial ribosomal protein MRP51 [Whalleya microplaca]